MQSLKLDKQLTVVTGAAQGIGAAVARALVGEGVRVAALDIDEDSLHVLAAELGTDGLFPYVVDVSKGPAVEQAIAGIEAEHGPIDGLVNVAGILRLQAVVDIGDLDWEQTFAVNATGVFNVSRSVARAMILRRTGAIVTVGSNATAVPRMNMAAYAASKAAAAHFTRCLGLELAPYGIRCNLVSPGSTDTAMQRQLWNDGAVPDSIISGSLEGFRTGIPLQRIASPEDIAEAVLFMLSERARHITLHDLCVDGGATLGA